ncbi:glycerol dehydrogenase [Enterovirga rhinocerotis]|nr:glycerol dehydrogenase [Enterovirga rhinocerotis]
MALRILGAPRRYIQGPGAVAGLPEIVATLGTRPVLIADPVALDREGAPLPDATVLRFAGEITKAEIARLAEAAKAAGADVVVGMGGGKAIDSAKGVSRRLGAPIVVVPTVASNDAPTSRLIVVYDEHHTIVEVEMLASNPDVVLVDTAIVARAPRRLLAAGIGDCMSKTFEAHACAKAGGHNFFQGRTPLAALALADACYATIRRDGIAALAACDRQVPDEALENVVESAVLLSGLGFESGGLSLAHSLTRGLTAHPKLAGALHGELVAYGTLVQVAHEGMDEAGRADIAAFSRACGLPTRLADLGLAAPSDEDYAIIAGPTLAAPHMKHLSRPASLDSIVAALKAVEAS